MSGACGSKDLSQRSPRLAVAIAASAVALLAADALTTLWISLSLAFSFGLYGIVRKQVNVGSLPGLTIESAIL
ncbi:MAG: EamA family transporter RarD, partial [Pseudomonadota bacterium]